MVDTLIQAVRGLPPELAVFLLSALPVTELRASLPAGITVFQLAPPIAFILAIMGNLLPLPFVFLLLPPVVQFAERRWPAAHRLMDRYFRALERKHRASYDKWGAVALFLFVAVPLPMTGVWTSSVLSILFGIRRSVAIAAIVGGVTTSALIVLAITIGALRLF